MTSPLAKGYRWAVLGLTVFTLGCLALIAERAPALALVNESASLPKGLYLRRPVGLLARGDVAAIPQPPNARAYLASLGMPADILLLKRAAAVGGDRVCRRGAYVLLPGRTVEVKSRDRRGARLPRWSDCRRLAADELFLLGDTPSSFDSRYFGPVRRIAVTGVYQETVTW